MTVYVLIQYGWDADNSMIKVYRSQDNANAERLRREQEETPFDYGYIVTAVDVIE